MGVCEITQVSDIVAELEGSLKVQERGNLISESPREYTLRRVFCRGGWGGDIIIMFALFVPICKDALEKEDGRPQGAILEINNKE